MKGKWRINLTLFLFLIVGVTILMRLFSFQVIDSDYWKALAQGQHRFHTQLQGSRGSIYLSSQNGTLHPLAVDRRWDFVYLSPAELHRKEEDLNEIATILSETLNLDKEFLLSRINRENSMYEKIKDRISSEEVDLLKEKNLPGVYIAQDNSRYYPQGSLASHIVGFVGGSGDGQYGIEGYYDDLLQGATALQEGERWSGGYLLKRSITQPQRGEDLILTIDYNIQFMAEKILKEYQKSLDFDKATIIVAEPNTGAILALANLPDFDPNSYSKERNVEIFKNQAIQSIFEPGSIFKSITFAIALEEDKITPQTKYIDEGFVKIGGHTIRNYAQRTWGEQTMTEALGKSINTAAVLAEKLIGHEAFLNYLDKFEFFEPTGIDLQGEVFSRNLSFKEGYEINFANASFGQGVSFTSAQIIKAFSALANGGRLIDPHLVVRDDVGPRERVISSQASSQITSMMVSVTEDGFAKTARVPGYYVAGKTGTAQIPWSALGISQRGYSDKTIQGFVGYAPASDPAFVMLVKLEDPKTRTAEYSAAPIFSELAKYILDYYQIPTER